MSASFLPIYKTLLILTVQQTMREIQLKHVACSFNVLCSLLCANKQTNKQQLTQHEQFAHCPHCN